MAKRRQLCRAAAFDFKSPHDPLEVKKAWFFFDKEYVCLGAGINSGSKLPVATTLNQCLLKSDVVLMSGNTQSTVSKGVHELRDVKWILHDSIAYLFPGAVSVNLANQPATGSWYKINHQSDSPKDEISIDVFKLWIDHGSEPEDATYQYIVIPSVSEKDMSGITNSRDIEILQNTTDIQAVKHSELNISQIVFYKAGEMDIFDGLILGIDSPGIVMIKSEGKNIKTISVSDPTRKLGKIHLIVSVRLAGKGDNYKASWNEQENVTEISIDLPRDIYAGKSVTIDF
jgi:chondroitin AC lyase